MVEFSKMIYRPRSEPNNDLGGMKLDSLVINSLAKQETAIRQGWMMTTLGNRNKQRLVPGSPRTIVALRRHWADYGLDLYDPAERQPPLLVLLAIPPNWGSARASPVK
jgi:hypothetical protein